MRRSAFVMRPTRAALETKTINQHVTNFHVITAFTQGTHFSKMTNKKSIRIVDSSWLPTVALLFQSALFDCAQIM